MNLCNNEIAKCTCTVPYKKTKLTLLVVVLEPTMIKMGKECTLQYEETEISNSEEIILVSHISTIYGNGLEIKLRSNSVWKIYVRKNAWSSSTQILRTVCVWATK
ncbi:hypothetical protein Smp_096230 [Schistosoma mansoni]|uniref:hypothetical protein n=1 Tax=Schistosoma mansoni TaxID=6183 RepID=UPI0001A622C7|nr:hypothetical protein Smp_096230 [Schistosoma mansoni]|eukprot:XP_018655395.1 hypothetical protein Smp_096230 [Schistosoma mansoni]